MKLEWPEGLLVIICAAVIFGCTPGLTKPGQRIYQIQSDYNGALTVAVAYKALPACPAALLCKKPEIVVDLQDADDIAGPAIKSAQTCVRSATCQNADLAVQAANSALLALTAITNKLQVK